MRLALAPAPSAAILGDLEKATFDEMVKGYLCQLDARNIAVATIDKSRSFLYRLQRELNSWPWLWEVAAWDRRASDARLKGHTVGTRRDDQGMVEAFTDYITDPNYGWVAKCIERFGFAPICLITEANRLLHVEEIESGIKVRPATRGEIQCIFDCIDDAVKSRMVYGKGAISAYRDSVLLKTTYAYGLRRLEVCELDTNDWHENIHLPEFGHFGALLVRNGKAKPRGPRRRRTVYTSRLMGWIVPEMERYLAEVRPLYRASAYDDHLFISDLDGALDVNFASKIFAKWRDAAGVDPAVTLHSLRRSFATHHVEEGYEAVAISEQMGHEWETSTAKYIYLDDDYRHLALLDAQRASGVGRNDG